MKKIFVILAGLFLATQMWADCTFTYFTTDGQPLTEEFAKLGTVKSHTYDVPNKKGVVTYYNQVTEIPTDFSVYTSLLRIDIPEGVTSIGEGAFNFSKELESVHLSSTVTSIGKNAFGNCEVLDYFFIPENCKITYIGPGAFYKCYKLGKFTLPEGITAINNDTFAYCQALSSINIPDGVETIGNTAFFNCSKLKSIIIPEGVTGIGDSAFHGTGLTSIVIPDSVERIGKYAFYECPLSSVALSRNLETIGERAFQRCKSIKSIIIPENVTSIGAFAFSSCDALESITCLNPVPPACGNRAFWTGKEYSMPVYVPCEGLEAYRAAEEWKNFGEHLQGGFHHYEFDITDDSKAYTCPCGLVDEETKAQYDARHYFSLTASEGDVTIGWKKVGTPADYIIQWSEDGIHWSQPETLGGSKNLVVIPDGATRYFRHGSTEAIERISSNQNNHWSFTMTSASGNASVEAGGNIMSLLDMTCQKNSLEDSPQHVFTGLFKGCDLLSVAPELPFTTLSQFCYMYMFEGTGITEAPVLPATNIPDGAYYGMFQDCKQLASAPELPGTRVARVAYKWIFKGCKLISEVSIADAMIIYNWTLPGDNPYFEWLDGAADQGKVKASMSMMGKQEVSPHLPEGWIWATEIMANEDPDSPGNFYTTFYNSRSAFLIPQGTKAYTAAIATRDGQKVVNLIRVEGGIIPKGTAVLLHSKEAANLEMIFTSAEVPAIEGNQFKGVDTTTAQLTSYDYFMFTHGSKGLGFYRMSPTAKLAPHKAYLSALHTSGTEGFIINPDRPDSSDFE